MHVNLKQFLFMVMTFCPLLPLVSQEKATGTELRISEGPSIMRLSAPGRSGSEYRALWDDDNLSSQWIISIDGETVSPVEQSWIRESSESGSAMVLEHRNRTFVLRQEMSLLPGGRHALLKASFQNNSTQAVRVSLNLLLDTSLGEINGLPFQLDSGVYVRGERFYTKRTLPKWIKTVKDIHSPALTILLDGKGVSRPETLTLANWRRLKEAGLAFQPVEGRNFDMLPFSRGDSALLLGFQEKNVPAGEKITVNIVMGLDETVPSINEASPVRKFAVTEEAENRRLRIYTIREHLAAIENQLNKLNQLLESTDELKLDSVVELENGVDSLERRRAEYENL